MRNIKRHFTDTLALITIKLRDFVWKYCQAPDLKYGNGPLIVRGGSGYVLASSPRSGGRDELQRLAFCDYKDSMQNVLVQLN